MQEFSHRKAHKLFKIMEIPDTMEPYHEKQKFFKFSVQYQGGMVD